MSHRDSVMRIVGVVAAFVIASHAAAQDPSGWRPPPFYDLLPDPAYAEAFPASIKSCVAKKHEERYARLRPHYDQFVAAWSERVAIANEAADGKNRFASDKGFARGVQKIDAQITQSYRDYHALLNAESSTGVDGLDPLSLKKGEFGFLPDVEVVQTTGDREYTVSYSDASGFAAFRIEGLHFDVADDSVIEMTHTIEGKLTEAEEDELEGLKSRRGTKGVPTAREVELEAKGKDRLDITKSFLWFVSGTTTFENTRGASRTLYVLTNIDMEKSIGRGRPKPFAFPAFDPIDPPLRVWQDVTKTYSFKGRFRRMSDNVVTLVGADGVERNLPIQQLSSECQKWVQNER